MKTLAALVILALATPAAALANPAATTKSDTAQADGSASVKAKDKLVCRREYGTGARTGSIKTCLTRAQWRQLDRTGSVEVKLEPSGQR